MSAGMREFAWWLGHPRLYRLIGFRWLCWRYRGQYIMIPDPRPIPPEDLERAKEHVRESGWLREQEQKP